METIKNEPAVLGGVAIAIATLITAFTSFTVDQDLAINGLAIAISIWLVRSKVTPVNKE